MDSTAGPKEGPGALIKLATARNTLTEELFARVAVNGGLGYARNIAADWIDSLPKETLLPILRRRVRAWQRGAQERKRRRVGRFMEDRGAAAASGDGAAPSDAASSSECTSGGSGSAGSEREGRQSSSD